MSTSFPPPTAPSRRPPPRSTYIARVHRYAAHCSSTTSEAAPSTSASSRPRERVHPRRRIGGIENLGGVDFDELILRRVVEHFDLTDIDLGQPDVLTGLNRLRRECTEAKEALSADTDVAIPVVLPGLDRTFRLHRTEFEEMIRPTVMQTIEHTRRVLEHTSAGELAGVVLVGGSSRIPLISELLTRELGVPVAVDTHPKHDVALGAALPDRPAFPNHPPFPNHRPCRPGAPAATTGSEPAAAVGTSAGAPVSAPDPRRRARLTRLLIVAAVVLALGAAAFVVRRWTDAQHAAPAARASPSPPSRRRRRRSE